MIEETEGGREDSGAPERLHELVMAFVREARLLRPDHFTEQGAVSLSQAFALHQLDIRGPLSQRDLAELLHLEKSTVSRMAADLERKGLLVREPDPANRRFYRLRLTGEGRELRAAMGAAAHGTYVRWTAMLSPAELDAALTGLAALVRVLREEPEPAPGAAPQ